MMKQIPGGPAGWLAYVLVEDIDAATQKAKTLGGKIMKDVTEVPGMGWLSIIQDADGSRWDSGSPNRCEQEGEVYPAAHSQKSTTIYSHGI